MYEKLEIIQLFFSLFLMNVETPSFKCENKGAAENFQWENKFY